MNFLIFISDKYLSCIFYISTTNTYLVFFQQMVSYLHSLTQLVEFYLKCARV